MNQLDILAQHRDTVLLAEAIGWLHDYRKCSDEILCGGGFPRPELLKKVPSLSGVSLSMASVSGLAHPEALEQLLHVWKGKDNDPYASRQMQYISRCHRTAHFDKQEPVDGAPDYPIVQISSPFGFSVDIPANVTNKLWSLPWSVLVNYSSANRDILRQAIRALFSQTVADTRRPVNEVDLWSWGLLVGALYKSALAGALLAGSPPVAHDLRWRLLGIRFNGLDYFLNVVRIPDLLARQELLSDSLNKVRDLLEITYPLGSEVYRDENGSIYVVPDVADLLERTDSSGASLRTLILQAFAQGTAKGQPNLQLGGELIPHLELEQQPWWGQDPDYINKIDPKSNSSLFGQPVHNELPKIEHFIAQKIISSAQPEHVRQFWQNGRVADICTVCGLRPQGPAKKAAERSVCNICEARRADRSQKWATSQPDRTIWTDEVADSNGRLALIVGQFDLTHWLDGNLLESLLLIAPHDQQNTAGKPITCKTPSFSRLRRIWETTRTFWREVQAESLERLSDDRRRLKIYLAAKPNLGPFHVYDLVVGLTDLSVVWVPPHNNNGGYLITAGNLSNIARQLGAETDVYADPATAAIFVENYLIKQFVGNAHQPILRNPDASTGWGRANLIEGIGVVRIDYQKDPYATAIPVIAEPRSFMMLVPADKSLDIFRLIKEKYEKEMGKVRDRLPLHLGCVYAHRRTPVRAVLDAGRAMLDHQTPSQKWRVESVNRQTQIGVDDLELELECSGHYIQWRMPLKMGDGTTEDRWYPYLFLDTGDDNSNADEPNRRVVKVSRPIGDKKQVDCWIVHAADLRPDETIYLWPSTFDFEFLDTTARRFDVSYGEDGRRRASAKRNRPYLLEDLEQFTRLWKLIATNLTTAQVKQLDGLIEAKREEWEQGTGNKNYCKTFEQFVCDTLKNAGWKNNAKPKDNEMNALCHTAFTGELHDVLELYMEILKRKPEQDKREV